MIHNSSSLYSDHTATHGGAFYIWSAGTVTIGECAEIRDSAATQGRRTFMQIESALHKARGAIIRDCHAAISGGGTYARVRASVKVEDVATGIEHCAAEVNGGGTSSEAEVNILLIAGHVAGNVAGAGNGSGLDISKETWHLRGRASTIMWQLQAAVLHSLGLVMLDGYVDVA